MDWTQIDGIETATVGRDRNEPVATGNDVVERMDGHDPEEYEFVSHSVYVHRITGGVECVADCWDREAAQRMGAALASALGVPHYDYTIDCE